MSSGIQALDITPCTLGERCETLRKEVRSFLREELGERTALQRAESWMGVDEDFSRKLGERGWIGMVWPRSVGGGEFSALERYVVLEEMLAAGAPVQAHWVADRQSGPLLLRFAPDTLARRVLSEIARGDTYFCIGMSEPDSGSDLASIRTKAVRGDGGWIIRGSKIWTTGAQRARYMIAFVRTDVSATAVSATAVSTAAVPDGRDRHAGFSQFLIDMSSPGITVQPIRNMLGEHEFNEVFLEDVWVPEENLIGQQGDGWKQVTAELAIERSGPERYMSSTELMLEMLQAADVEDDRHAVALGRLVADYGALRQMSIGIAGMLARGDNPAVAASVVKDQGARLEKLIPELAQDLFGDKLALNSSLREVLSYTLRSSPSFTLRGGTPEILRGIIARGMGLR
ncbi:acyl-CoA dehydrogenase family protein [Glaciimonas sp. CA11.2]|uniref:acyl-CoA dehydrogenase family protein n=1 Tax=Glaciimonas sp. CA11.2 TaxID=3048601 RepID=UPI002AB4749C|nr:acyl-CoA dehydrogenase family protein [Glaciimonas sp. CA11.2]MDY7547101.1 acyl-CoA dehydrogenase family protein [Glaciimonas sp. CA11.2]MEB0161994.1 acyl-CoA dehydrogenase family protein [Glaciimonas sp. CA11.2]